MTWPFVNPDGSSLAMFGYDFIMIDPPWRFVNWSARGEGKSPQAHYRCMSLEDIEALPVADLARASGALLWLWATHPMLPQALDVMKAWRFSYVTSGVWVKRTRGWKLFFGTGYVLRSASEPFLIGRLGAAQSAAKNIRTVIEGRVRENGRKPDEAYAAAEAMAPRARRADVFSRETRPGWDAFGDEIGKFDEEKAA